MKGAWRDAAADQVQYEDLPPVLTIDDAIKAEATHRHGPYSHILVGY